MIVGTAGHIDHGKTTLVRSLTGTDTDRLPEEKRRGISIELGYAFLRIPGSERKIGFVDVPGHEKLVHTMISGATGIDFCILLVAADDGPMPQTREHLAVLSLLNLDRGVVALTKCDRVDAARLTALRNEVQAMLRGTSLQQAPIVAVSSVTGYGLDELRALLFDAASGQVPSPGDRTAFRLAVDRSFTLDGVGTVVTGTVHAGDVKAGDELHVVPGTLRARVRSLHAQNEAASVAATGQRTALALVGLSKDQISRGQWLVNPGVALQTTRLDARLTVWPAEASALRSGTQVHVHLGAADVHGTVAVLREGDFLAPGTEGLVQLVLQRPIGAWWGDRFVLRDSSATRTLAGGRVLDPFAPTRYRRTPQRLAELAALTLPCAQDRLRALLAAAPNGLDLQRYAAAQGRPLPDLPVEALQILETRGGWAIDGNHAAAARRRALQSLADFHAGHPHDAGPDPARLRRLAAPRMPELLWNALVDDLRKDNAVFLRGAFLQLPTHAVQLSATEVRISEKAAPLLESAGFEGAWVRDLARGTQEPEPLVRVTLARLAQRGELHQIVKDLYLPPGTMFRLGSLAREIAAHNDSEVTAARFRDATQLGRKRAIQVLEYLDRIGLLRRIGDVHRLRSDSLLFQVPLG